ncbi:MinD/ParA family protein [Alkalihalophilus lindianensis]|uniref:MinD/ParA family protein n=1 Tax=Alkalihalophilus lindianensis TaxID=1630542 RepID=A0ABU3XC36_9BACI|nr:MinD/ParA family protein [Alkalihalophilus lindianensis]MDV2685448.1 MinD/ParA family protein [Alkalihalophilus lindianensis]
MMNDQAESLRRIVNPHHQGSAKVIAVVSGKGGVGKSNVCLNFALTLRDTGEKVAIIDMDMGMGNLDILMGVTASHHIIDMLKNQLTIWDIVEKGPKEISYLAGGSGLSEFVELDSEQMERFFTQLGALEHEFDYVFLDMGAGATKETIKFILAAHEILVITTPEPTAITDAYAMVKYIHLEDEDKQLSMIVNRAETTREGDQTATNFMRVTKQFLDKEIQLLGSLPDDRTVSRAVKAQTPFVLFAPRSEVSVAMKSLVNHYLGESSNQPTISFSSFIRSIRSRLVKR